MTTQWVPSRAGHAARTDVGIARDHNEDRYLVQPPLFIVADGLGGHSAGEVAAQMLVDRLAELRADSTGVDLVGAIEAADRLINEASNQVSERKGMSTTCVAILLGDGQGQVSHVGDSRAYRLRSGKLSRLTEDHSVVAELVRGGIIDEAQAETDDRRHMLTQALGSDRRATVTSTALQVEAGDRYVLCSDGLSSQVSDAVIEAALVEHGDPGLAADELVRLANAAGGNDNVTVIVVDAKVSGNRAIPAPLPPAARTPARRRRMAPVVAIVGLVLLAGLVSVAAGFWSTSAPPATSPSPSPSAAPSVGIPSGSSAEPSRVTSGPSVEPPPAGSSAPNAGSSGGAPPGGSGQAPGPSAP